MNPLNNYIKHYEELTSFKNLHLGGAAIAYVVGSILGVLSYVAMTQGLLPLALGQPGAIATSVSGALILSNGLLIGIIFHYVFKITDKENACDEDSFLKALMSSNTLQENLTSKNLTALLRRFSDERWNRLMSILDGCFFGERALYQPSSLKPVLAALCQACPTQMLQIYCEQETLSNEFREFLLKPYILELVDRLTQMPCEIWSDLLVEFANIKESETKYKLFKALAAHNPSKFFAAYLKAKDSCSKTFCEKVEERLIYQEKVMTVAWNELYELNRTYFILRFFELKSKGGFSDEDSYYNQILETLTHQTFRDWSQLLKGIDQLYFISEGKDAVKSVLISELITIDKEKLLQAFQAAYFKISEKLIKQIENLIKD